MSGSFVCVSTEQHCSSHRKNSIQHGLCGGRHAVPQLDDPLEPRLAGDSVHRRLLLRCRLWRRPPMRFSVGFCVGFCMGLWVRLRVGLRHGLGARLRLGCLAAAVAAGHRLRGRLARGRPGGRHWDDPAVRCGASRRRRRRHCGWGRGWDWSAREERRRACRRHGAGRPASHCHWSHMALWRLSCRSDDRRDCRPKRNHGRNAHNTSNPGPS